MNKMTKNHLESLHPESNWKLPTIELLHQSKIPHQEPDRNVLVEQADVIVKKLSEFGVDGEITAMRIGPTVTIFEFKPAPGIRISRIAELSDDLTMALSLKSVRILAPLPGKAVIGIEIPSQIRESVALGDLLESREFSNPKHKIPIAIGKEVGGQFLVEDLGRMPHLLIGGKRGSGKSIFTNGLITSLLFRFTPSQLGLILIDQKFIEFSFYQDIPHLLFPVLDDAEEASNALKWVTQEVDRRIRSFESAQDKSEKTENFPLIVVVIDDFEELIQTGKNDIESSIKCLLHRATRVVVHLVLSTRSPLENITGMLRSFIPARVSGALTSSAESCAILGTTWAEKLLGGGDMLFISSEKENMVRVQCGMITDHEVIKLADFLRSQGLPRYKEVSSGPAGRSMDLQYEVNAVNKAIEKCLRAHQIPFNINLNIKPSVIDDPLYKKALGIVLDSECASASLLQRRMAIGYNLAARLIEAMEAKGVVGPALGGSPREILI